MATTLHHAGRLRLVLPDGLRDFSLRTYRDAAHDTHLTVALEPTRGTAAERVAEVRGRITAAFAEHLVAVEQRPAPSALGPGELLRISLRAPPGTGVFALWVGEGAPESPSLSLQSRAESEFSDVFEAALSSLSGEPLAPSPAPARTRHQIGPLCFDLPARLVGPTSFHFAHESHSLRLSVDLAARVSDLGALDLSQFIALREPSDALAINHHTEIDRAELGVEHRWAVVRGSQIPPRSDAFVVRATHLAADGALARAVAWAEARDEGALELTWASLLAPVAPSPDP